jgi:hypothetical protein
MAISNDLLSTTLYSIRDSAVDGLYRNLAFLDRAKAGGGIEVVDGGTQIQRPLITTEHSSTTLFQTGYEKVNLSVADVLRPMVYEWCDFAAPIVITKKEEMENSSEYAIIKILEARTKTVMGTLQRQLQTRIFRGTGPISTLSTLYCAPTASLANAFLWTNAHPTDAGGGGTVGGLARSVAPLALNNQVVDEATAGTTVNEALTLAWIQSRDVSPTGGVNAIFASSDGFRLYQAELQANERYINKETLEGGRMSLAFGNAPVEYTSDMDTLPGEASDGTAASVLFYGVNFQDGIKMAMHPEGDFVAGDFYTSQENAARVAHIYFKGQLIADHLGSCFVVVQDA